MNLPQNSQPSSSSHMQSGDNEQYGSRKPDFYQNLIINLCRSTVLGRGKAKGWMWPLLARTDSACFDLPVRNYVMRLHPRDNTVERKLVLRPDRYCPEEISFLSRLFGESTEQNCMVYIDIGANVGALSLPVAKFETVKVIAVEPEPSAYARLAFNVKANHLTNVTLENVAISDRSGTMEFISHTDDLKLSGINGRWSKGPCIEVAAMSLQELLDKHGISKIDVIKVDVEGHEDKIIMPFFRVADRSLWPSYIIIEAIEREGLPDCIDYLKHIGYKPIFKNRANLCLELEERLSE